VVWAAPLVVAGGVGWLMTVADSSARSLPVVQPVRRPLSTDLELWSYPGVVNLHIISASEADLRDDQLVIGVSVGGRHRAYLIDALRPLEGHVVNDYFADAPVTVSYCDLHECVKVYTDDGIEHPLDVGVGGTVGMIGDGSMFLTVSDDRYRQDTGRPLRADAADPFPYAVTSHRRTTWGEWRATHPEPETDVYVGPANH
jgi:hypothetical protein